ncbi:hypothetical protein K488DRAFT_47255, partial [Vararia minispora EC-137]
AVPFLRAYPPCATDHFYTIGAAEMNLNNAVAGLSHTHEGNAAGVRPTFGGRTIPFYRTYRTPGIGYFYTTSETERSQVVACGASDEGIAACGRLLPRHYYYPAVPRLQSIGG